MNTLTIQSRSMLANIITLSHRELKEAIASRWFLLYTLAFASLGLGVSYVSASSSGNMGLEGFGRTSAGLANLVQLIVPLMGLSAGAGSIAGDRERGMLQYMLAQPITRTEYLAAKFVSLAVALSMSISFGFGISAGVISSLQSAAQPTGFILLAGLTILLALSMLSIGMLISIFCRKTSVAMGIAIFVWLILVFATDFGLMAGTFATQIPIESLFAMAIASPLQVFKMWSLQRVNASLDVLGPAGLYAQVEYGSSLNWIFLAVLIAWIVLPLLVASFIFRKRVAL